MSFTRSTPSRKQSPGRSAARTSRRNAARGSGSRLPIVEPRNAIMRRPEPVSRSSGHVLLEVADDACHGEPGIFGGEQRAGLRQRRLIDVEADVPAQRSGGAQRVEQQPGLLRRAGAELDERLGLGQLGDLRRLCGEDRAFGAGGVVLGEPGDLVEELAAALVVKPLGRQGFRLAVSPARTSARSAGSSASGSRWRWIGSVRSGSRFSQVGDRDPVRGRGEQAVGRGCPASRDRRRRARWRPRPRRG